MCMDATMAKVIHKARHSANPGISTSYSGKLSIVPISCCVLPLPENRSAAKNQTCIPDYFLLTSVWLIFFISASLLNHRKNKITCWWTAYSTAVKREMCLSYKSTLLVKKNEKTIYYQLPPTLKKLKMASSVITFLSFVPQSLFLFLLNVIWKKDVFKHFTATINMKLCSCEKSVA